MTPKAFISKIAPLAVSEMARSRVPASLTIAQAILESGWGTSELATKANNLFGIKGTGPAGIYQYVSPEYVDNKKIEKLSDFRKYNTWHESIKDHTAKLLEPRYSKALGASYRAACHAVQEAGYATDPNYAQELIKRIEKYKLDQYDTQGGQTVPLPTLIIDPGHGGSDPGAVGENGLREKDLTLQISLYQYARFQALGVPVILTRTSDIALTPEQRTKLVRDSGAKYCLSNHINAGGGEGVEAIYSIFSKDTLAKSIVQALVDCGMKYRRVFSKKGANEQDYYFMHRDTGSVDTTIIEYGFIDNPGDIKKLKDNWKSYAESVVKAFCGFIGANYHVPTTHPQKEEKPVSIKLDKESAEKVIGVLGALWTATSDQKVKDATHYAANALRDAVGIPK